MRQSEREWGKREAEKNPHDSAHTQISETDGGDRVREKDRDTHKERCETKFTQEKKIREKRERDLCAWEGPSEWSSSASIPRTYRMRMSHTNTFTHAPH